MSSTYNNQTIFSNYTIDILNHIMSEIDQRKNPIKYHNKYFNRSWDKNYDKIQTLYNLMISKLNHIIANTSENTSIDKLKQPV